MLQILIVTLLVFSVTSVVYSDNCSVEKCPSVLSGQMTDISLVMLPIPSDCTKFLQCGLYPQVMNCPSGLHFNKDLQVCDSPASANCVPCVNSGRYTKNTLPNSRNNSREESVCKAATADNYLFPLATDCSKYIMCSNGIEYVKNCPAGLHFNNDIKVCDYVESAGCDGAGATEGVTEEITPSPNTQSSISSGENTSSSGVCAQANDDNYLFPFPNDCTKFISCSNGTPYTMDCPAGLHFNNDIKVCDYVESAGCDGAGATEGVTEEITPSPNTQSSTSSGENTSSSGVCAQANDDNYLFPFPNDCTKFISCSNGTPYTMDCPAGLHFNNDIKVCDYVESAGCHGAGATEGVTEDITPSPNTQSSTSSGENTSSSGVCAQANDDNYLFPFPNDCTKFISCSNGTPYTMDCPAGLHFNNDIKVCDYVESAGCDGAGATEGVTEDITPSPNTQSSTSSGENTSSSGVCAQANDDNYLFPFPNDCTKFISCSNGTPYTMDCPAGLHFNNDIKVCDYVESAGCDGAGATEGVTEEITPSPNTQSSTSSGENTSSSGVCAQANDDNYLFPFPNDCTKFISCSNGTPYTMDCPAGLHFNNDIKVCDYVESAGCDGAGATEGVTEEITPSPNTQSSTSSGENTSSSGVCAQANDDNYLFPFPNDCTKFISCSNGTPYTMDCPGGLHFNNDIKVCDYVESAGCDGAGATEGVTEEITPSPNTQSSTSSGENTSSSGVCAQANDDNYLFPFPNDCTKFISCSNGTPYTMDCPAGLHFNNDIKVCDYVESAGCDGAGATEGVTEEITPSPNTQSSTSSGENTSSSGVCAQANDDNYLFPFPNDCTKFISCSNGTPYTMDCPAGLHFNNDIKVCDYVESAGCDGAGATEGVTEEITPSPNTQSSTSSGENTSSSGVCAQANDDNYLFPFPNDCTKFISCSNGTPYTMDCPAGLHFNNDIKVCDYVESAGCDGAGATEGVTEDITPSPNTQSSTSSGEYTSSSGVCAQANDDNYLFPFPNDCTKFISCSNGTPYTMDCPAGLHFNNDIKVCDYVESAGCDGAGATEGVTEDITPSPNTQSSTSSGENTSSSGVCAQANDDNYLFPFPNDCTKFISCSNGTPYTMDCPAGLHFNNDIKVCDYVERAGCDGAGATEGVTEDITPSPNTQSSTSSGENTSSSGVCAQANDDNYLFPFPNDCTKFISCSNGTPYTMDCPAGLHFNNDIKVCDYVESAGCDGAGATEGVTEDITPSPNTQSSTSSGENTSSSGVCAQANDDNYLFPFPNDCTKFISCSNGTPYTMDCPVGLHFNNDIKVCDYVESAGCDGAGATEGVTEDITPSPNTQSSTSSGENTSSSGVCAQANDDNYLFPFPNDCTKFISCSNGTPYTMDCPVGLHFNNDIKVCDYVESAGCDGAGATEEVTEDITPSPNTQSSTSSGENTSSSGVCAQANDDNYLFPFPNDCTKFISCSNGTPYTMDCPAGLHFNNDIKVCDYVERAGCGGAGATEGVTEEITPSPNTQSSTSSGENTSSSGVCAQANDDNYLFPFPNDCTKFISCSNGTPYTMDCPAGLHFNNDIKVCDYVESAGCDGAGATEGVTEEITPSPNTQSSTSSGENTSSSGVCAQANDDNYLFPFPNDCTKFISCSNGTPYTMDCPAGLHFNNDIKVCDYVESAGCDGAGATEGVTEDITPSPNTQSSTSSGENTSSSGVCAQANDDNYLFPFPNDCTKFISCSNGTPYTMDCPVGLHFNNDIKVCDYVESAGCDGADSSQSTSSMSAAPSEQTSTTTPTAIYHV